MGTRTDMNTTKAATGYGIDQTRHPLYHTTPNTHTHTHTHTEIQTKHENT
jgi:hypothetical protein